MALSRRKARELALRALYAIDLTLIPTPEALQDEMEEHPVPGDQKEYAERITFGVRGNLAELDSKIEPGLSNYTLDRLAAIDRNLLRIATYELYYQPSTPPAVSIDEAVSLAKKYSTKESGQFVNGVLSYVLEHSPKKDWDPATAPHEFEEDPADEGDEAEKTDNAQMAEPEEELVTPDSEAEEEFKKIGRWTIKVDNP